jgi:hypothetical protein
MAKSLDPAHGNWNEVHPTPSLRRTDHMVVNISLPLFGTPGQELGEGSAAKGQQLLALSLELQSRLEKAAHLLDQLERSGWSARVAVHDILLAHAQVRTEEEAKRQIQELGLDPEQFVIMEELADDEAA